MCRLTALSKKINYLKKKFLLDFSLAIVCHIVSLVIEGSIAHTYNV